MYVVGLITKKANYLIGCLIAILYYYIHTVKLGIVVNRLCKNIKVYPETLD